MNQKVNDQGIGMRIFVVGSPRSGTTFLQGLLAAHSDVHSLPETFFFAKVQPRSWLKRTFLWPAIKVRRHLLEFVAAIGRDDLSGMATIGLLQSDYHVPFVNLLDFLAVEAGKSVWVEKTPLHLYCLEEIHRCVPDAVVVHIVRDGKDVVASLYNATRNNPQKWAHLGRNIKWKNWTGYSIDECVDRWNRDISITEKYSNNSNHIIVRYEDLIEKREESLRSLCARLGLNFEIEMLDSGKSYDQIVVKDREPWKENNKRKYISPNQTYNKIFTELERAHIAKRLKRYHLGS